MPKKGKVPRRVKPLPFKKARSFARKLGLTSWREWEEFVKGNRPDLPPRPPNIPKSPSRYYKNLGWMSSNDWLGKKPQNREIKNNKYLPFLQAREFVRALGLTSVKEWNAYRRGQMPHLPKKPDNIPTNPYPEYRHLGWQGTGDWLGIIDTYAKPLPRTAPFPVRARLARNRNRPHRKKFLSCLREY